MGAGYWGLDGDRISDSTLRLPMPDGAATQPRDQVTAGALTHGIATGFTGFGVGRGDGVVVPWGEIRLWLRVFECSTKRRNGGLGVPR